MLPAGVGPSAGARLPKTPEGRALNPPEAFSHSPSGASAAWARGLLETLHAGIEEGRGAVAVRGEMVDLANIKLAENVLAKAQRIEARRQR